MQFSKKTQYEGSGIPQRHSSFQPHMSKSEEWTKNYETLKSAIDKNGVAVLIGDRGTGKTQAGSCSIGYTIYRLEETAKYTKAFDVFLSVRNTHRKESEYSELEMIESYIKPHLLVIDAFEVRGETAFEDRILNHIIDKRYDYERPTIIITNDDVNTFTELVGDSFVDRMKSCGGFIQFRGKSFR